MTQTFNFEEKRFRKSIKIPRLKEICPKEKCFYSDGTFFIIYMNNDKVYPNVGEIDEILSEIRHKVMIKCYLSIKDTLRMIESVLFPNIEERESFATLIEELSKLHNTKNKKIEEVVIEYGKIEELYNAYKDVLESCSLYKFCYYWCALCIALDFREIEGKRTVIGRSMIVKDAIAYIREQIKRQDFGKSWDDVKKRVGPTKRITGTMYSPVKKHKRRLKSSRFVNKKDEEILVESHGKLIVTTSPI